MAYTRVNWEDLPSTNTPINKTNLNKMDKGIYDATYENGLNVSNEVDEDYRVNLLEGNNLFKGSLFTGIINEGGDYSGVNTRITNANSTTMKTFILKQGTYTVDVPGLDYCAVITKNENGTRVDDFADSWKALPFTFTTTQDAYIYISARKSDNSVLNPNNYSFILQEGSTIEPIQYNQIVVDNEKYTDTLNVDSVVDSRSRVNVLHSKNLLPNNGSTITTNGITFTKNSDGSITINGTSTARADLYIFGGTTDNGNYLKIKKGTYSFDRNNLTDGKIFFAFREKTAGTKYETLTNNGAIEAMATQDCYFYGVMIGVENGNTINNLTIYPMLNEGNTLLPYEPYVVPSIVVDNEEIYSKEDTDIVDITGELTFATGWSIDSGKICKQGKHIFGTIQIKTPSSLPASTNSQNVVRIPYTLANSYIMGGFTTNGDKWALTNGFAYVYISSNGYATIVNSSIATFFRLQIDVMEA